MSTVDLSTNTMASNNAEECEWIHLNTGKAFSRLLYTNPVCFMCTSCAHTTSDSTLCAKDNVMVLSWLTATNNEGRFMFSIHKSRYSALILTSSPTDDNRESNNCNHTNNFQFQVGIEFTLSVPIKGMEQMVLDVGSISGRYGSKFPKDKHNDNNNIKMNEEDTKIEKLSNRQRKKQKMQQLTIDGVHGLVPVPFGNVNEAQSSLFAIKGTVAHLKCKTYAVMGSSIREEDNESSRHGNEKRQSDDKNMHSPIIDDDHLLIMAEVTDGYVHPSYWDDKKQLFRPNIFRSTALFKVFWLTDIWICNIRRMNTRSIVD